ncbi:MAG: LptA/OstA family protein [Brevundimonas sp.]|uniref:LptA/OstA family protein n=1 Tax=Brevundimonas sp. TaxID=1871086 RepID=UPI0027187C49|nr:LptA/OstA family protein [Brevundimonas sp.]MDO9076504.1 LptA/OstA family protein [Brevundimonas sp.]MDP3371242.1 LptA/OstA family protein [Brevundimonas sp.]MDZ4062054.1 LptA/OstA family protein [Brevundimonas sp.]
MSKTRTLTIAATSLALLALPTMGDAQTRPNSSDQPISFGADAGEYVGNTVTLRGRAELIQGDNRLRADTVSGLNQTGESVIEASGNVYFVTPEQTIRGDRAVYTTANDMIVVTGDVILTQGQNVLTGSRLTYNVRTQSARIEAAGQGRIRGVFYPERSGN